MLGHPVTTTTLDPGTPGQDPGNRGIGVVWATLVAAPLALALPFCPVVAFLAIRQGLEGEALIAAVQRVAVVPATAGFCLIALMTWLMARRDGLSLRTLGWFRPGLAQLAIGVSVGALVAAINHVWLYPLIQRFQPTFDPSMAEIPLGGAVLMFTVAVAAEESLYRGYALVRLRGRYGSAAAVAATSLFYALLAPGPDAALKVWALGFGAVLAIFRLFTGCLWPVAAAHLMVSLGPKLLASLLPTH